MRMSSRRSMDSDQGRWMRMSSRRIMDSDQAECSRQVKMNDMGGFREQMGLDRDGLVRVSLEGNIGVGKSTMLHLLQADPRLQRALEVLEEPVVSSKNVNGTGLNMLQAYYENPERYASLFQSYVFITRFLLHNSAARKSRPALLVTERSVSTDRVVFVEALVEQGYLDELEAVAYVSWYNAVVSTLPNVLADCFIYLRASPDVCYERLKSRARSEEAGIGLDYLQLLHRKHDDWFLRDTCVLSDDHVTVTRKAAMPSTAPADAETYGGGGLRIIDKHTIPSGIQGRLVLVVDCSSNLNMAEKSPERDAILDQIVSFLLSQLSAESRSRDCFNQVSVRSKTFS